MLLNSNQILEYLIPNGKGKSQQVSYDLTLKYATKIIGGQITKSESRIEKYQDNIRKVGNFYIFDPGVYSITFHQGIKLSDRTTGEVRPRSSLLRCGAFIGSSIFDPGFECNEIGCTLFVCNHGIKLEIEARIAHFIIHENYPTEKYDGQYQKEKDIK